MRTREGLAIGASFLTMAGGALSIKHGTDLEGAYNRHCPPLSLTILDDQCSAEDDNIRSWKLGGATEILGGIGLIGVVLIVSGSEAEARSKTQRDSKSLPPTQS